MLSAVRRFLGRQPPARSNASKCVALGCFSPTADDAVFQTRIGAFQQELALLGWSIGRNVHIDIHWASANANEIRRHAAELVALSPDVILGHWQLDHTTIAA